MTNRITVRELRDKLADLDDDLQVWVSDGSSEDGYSPLTGAVAVGYDPAPKNGDPYEFAVLDAEQ